MRRTRPVIAVTALVLALGSAAPAFATDPEPTQPMINCPLADEDALDLALDLVRAALEIVRTE
ncbi:hypothetical protein ACH4KU_31635 [Streptomyces althioticus]|uniref:hypothetical protein n=1 Tax=Streptomyces althioticus TaxID=83380 RepID=UPI0037AC12E0